MCVSQHRWADPRSHGSSALLLLLVIPLFLLSSFSPLAQGAITIPRDYKEQNILQPPVLTELPESHTAFSLDDISLTCEATGTPTPLFRWTKDGQEFGLERNTSGSFTADVADQLSDYHGDYRCYASNILGTAMTRSIQIITEATPILHKSKKQKKRVDEGDSLILHCSPPKSSTPPLVHWMDNKLLHIGQSERVMTGLDGNLYFANVLKTDSRDDYSCHAQYVHARTILPKEAISVSVTPSNDVVRSRKPHLLRPQTSHSSMMALRGHSLTLECIPRGLPTPRVEWQKKDGTLAGRVENYGRWLHFDSVTQEDDGEYECRAINSLGTTTHPFTVTVEAEPYWEKKPRDLMYAPGETVRLDCLADGIPTPTITWRINGYPITAVDPDPRRSVSSGMLILQNVKYSDTAVYQCEATNKHGNILINTYIYVIELPPQILSSDAMVYQAVEGGDIRLDCSAFGSPLPHVTWESKGMDLLSDPRFSLLTNGTVMLSEASRKDTRTYTCTLRNTNISISAHLEVLNRTVIVNGPPDLRVLRGQAALLDCEFIKDAQLARPQIVWRKDGHKLQEDKHTVFENGTFLLTNVQSDDGGQYSCEVITTLDHAESSGSITVMARPDPPKALSLSEEKDRSLTLSWIPGDSHNSPITAFVVEVREEKHVEESSWRWEEKRNVPGDVNHLELLLQPDSTYSFRVTAVNELGRSKPCNTSKSITTLPAVPDSRPTGVRSNSSNPGTLVIVWDELDKSLHNGPDFLYKVSWRQAEGRGQQWQHVMAKGPPYEVNEVGTYTAFEVKVQAVNSLGEGPLPEPVIGHSGENSPLEPPGGVVTSVTNSTVRVKWNKAQKVRGLLLGYKIYIKWLGLQGGRGRRALEKKEHAGERDRRAKHGGGEEVEEGNEEVRVVVVHSGVQTEEEVTELKLYSHYEVSVTAFNSKGEGPPSPPHHFSTPEGAPGPPASLTFESQSETELTLHWSPPSQPNGILTGYTLQYHPVVESKDSPLQMEEIHDPTVTHFVLQDLDPNRRYLFYLMGRTGVHQGLAIIREGATLLDGVPPNNITMVAGDTSVNLSWVPGDRYRNHAFRVSILRKSAGGQWEESEEINSTAAFYSLTGLQPGTVYHLNITHGNHTYWDDIIKTSGPVVREVAGAFASQGWFIGLISAIVLLMLLLLILCFVKRNKGGKYAVKDKEEGQIDSEARPMKDDTFGEYSDGDEKRSVSQPSLCVDSKRGSDDSLAEYGDSVDIQFNEDGSFIGQYSGRGPVPHGNESSGPASPVNPAPPPPIAPSMSSILNRPL